MEGWCRDETGIHYAVKGDVDACELRPRRGFPDKTDAATNRRWVTADTPPITQSLATPLHVMGIWISQFLSQGSNGILIAP